jgi:hypothetical protein
MANTAIATIDKFILPAVAEGNDFAADEYEDITPAFPRVKIPAGGALAFELPNPEDPDDPTPSKTIEGIIVYQHSANSYWEHSDTNNTPPDCYSMDGVRGKGDPGGVCADCPLNQFGSGEGGNGKACKNMKQLYVLRSGDIIPLQLSLPPTSLKAFREYMNNLRFGGYAPSGVLTQISLKKNESNGNTFSVAAFKRTGVLSAEIAQQSKKYAADIRAQMQQIRQEMAPPAYDAETGEIKGEEESLY